MTKTDLLKLIHIKCIDCCCGEVYEVKMCTARGCPLWEFRFGKDPYKRTLSAEEKEARVASLAVAREKRMTQNTNT